ncbi:MAG TPA: Ger(x)C family spore germination protein [Symbiobacteriaceae bacterium]|nr:Ger(x)C family spore germination protein [Symbiobacteriaceae bacterium]
MRRPARLVAALALAALLLTGCWDRREIEDVGFVMAVGLDKAKEKALALTVQIAIPRNITVSAGGGAGGGGGGASGEKPPVLVQTVEADSITEALRDLETLVNRRVSFVHTLVVIFGKELAKDDIAPHLGILTRFRQFRRGMMVMVAEERAAEILTTRPRLEENPAVFLEDLTRRAHERTARAPRVDLHHFLLPYESLAQEPVMPIVRLHTASPGLEHKTLQKAQLEGTAVFKGGRMVGELTGDESEMFLVLTDQTRAFVETVPRRTKNGKIALEVTVEGTETKVSLQGGRPSLSVSIVTEAELREIQGEAPEIVTIDGLRELEERVAGQLTTRANALVKKLQTEMKVDIVGFGHSVRGRFIDWPAWEAYNWPKRFPETKIEVSVKTMIRRVGMTFQTPDRN